MKPKVIWLLAGLLLVTGATVVFLFPRLRAEWLSQRLHAAKTPSEAVALVERILSDNTEGSRDLVAEYTAQSPLRAFDRKHSISLLHDDSDGNIYQVVNAPQGSVEVANGSGLSEAQKGDLREAVFKAMPKATRSVKSIGEPPKTFDGIHLLEHEDETGRVRFILREKGEGKYFEIRLTFQNSRLVSDGLHDVSEEDVSVWSKGDRWPKNWK